MRVLSLAAGVSLRKRLDQDKHMALNREIFNEPSLKDNAKGQITKIEILKQKFKI